MGNEPVGGGWITGNVHDDSTDTRGWQVGHFIDPSRGVCATKDVEMKWASHPAGDKRSTWVTNERRSTLVMLISGEFRIDLAECSRILDSQGDYLAWGPGVGHTWVALDDSVVVTVRWPSIDIG
jgi:hypothetical protein